MNRPCALLLLALLLPVQLGCGQKDADKGPADKGPAATVPAAGLPAECQALTAALDTLTRCDKIPETTRTKIVDGYHKMMKVMIDAGDPKMNQGCQSGVRNVEQTLKYSGC